MADFSHLSRPPLSASVRRIERGVELTGDEFAMAVEQIEPPLLDAARMDALRQELVVCLSGKPGAPRAGQSRRELAESIRTIRRADVPPVFLAALASHLDKRREPPKEVFRKLRTQLGRRQLDERNFLIRALYRIFYDLAASRGPWKHELLGEIEPLAEPAATRSEQAVQLTHRFLRDKGFRPPAERTMMNLVRQRNR